MGSRRFWLRVGVVALLLAAVAVAVAVPGVGKWIVAAVLAGLASALGGIVARGADKAIMRGRDAVLVPTPQAPLTVRTEQEMILVGHVGPLPEDLTAVRSLDLVSIHECVVRVFVEAAVDRAVILTKLDVQVQSRCTPPPIGYVFRLKDELNDSYFEIPKERTFEVDLGGPTPVVRPAEGVPDFPYGVSHLEPERFILRASASTPGDFSWRVGVHWICKGESGVVVAEQEGQPFRLVSLGPSEL